MIDQIALNSAYNYAARMLSAHARQCYDWKGAVHLALAEAAQRWDSSKEASFSTYAHYQIRGRILDMLRKGIVVSHKRKDNPSLTFPIERQYALVDDAASRAIERIERADVLRSRMKYLNDKERKIIFLWLQGFTGNEIADMHKENRNTIRAQLSRAKKFLQEPAI